jgi:FAD/FMN-containing dehydrogenase
MVSFLFSPSLFLKTPMPEITNWGNYPRMEAEEYFFETPDGLGKILSAHSSCIARGMGRCYGDSSLNKSIASTLQYNKIAALDEQNGIITCQAGATLEKILEMIIPKGWFIPVTPGTKFITVGGAIAADVHGKNHHSEGTFTDHVLWFDIMLHDGTILRCSKKENVELFHLTCGGMGLTGIILSASFGLKKIETSGMRCENIRAANLEEVMKLFDDSSSWTYSVAWIDCLATGKSKGRSIMMRGEHARKSETGSSVPLRWLAKKKINIPVYFPSFALSTTTVKAFNELYYRKSSPRNIKYISSMDSFFYPLDALRNWNRIYGRRGFTQYQCVIPAEDGSKGINEILSRVSRSGKSSFLAVIKLFGEQNKNLLSFPMKGYTLAMDFPVESSLFSLLDELDEIVAGCGGRVYLAKDMRLNPVMLQRMYPALEKFCEGIRKYNPSYRFRSLQSDRTGITR